MADDPAMTPAPEAAPQMMPDAVEDRILILAPAGRDSQVASALLAEAGLRSGVCTGLPAVAAALQEGAACVLLTQEAVATADLHPLAAWVAAQPAWSDMPFIVVTERGGGPERNAGALRLLDALGNATLIERPFHPVTLISVARMALRSRHRQYQARAQLQELARRQAALRDSEARLRVAQSAGGVGTFEWFPAAKTLEVSDEYRRIWGLAPEGPVTEAMLIALIDPDDRALTGPERFGRFDNPLEYAEFRIQRPDTGEQRWIARRGVQVPGDDGTGGPRFVGVAFDVTPRRMMEAALEESEALFRSTFEQAAVGIAHVALDGRWLLVNSRLCKMLGYRADELMRLRFQDVTHPEDLEADLTRTAAMISGAISTYDMEKRYLRKDGSVCWINLTVSMLRDETGAPRHFVSVIEDISERKATEAELARSRAQLEVIFQTVPVAIMLAEAPSGRIVFGNEAASRIFRSDLRFSREAATYVDWEAYHADGQRARADEYPLTQTLRTGIAVDCDYQFRCGDGVRRWINVSTAPIKDEAGAVTGAVMVCTDIDELRRAQLILARDNSELERLVAARTQALEAAQAQLAHAQRMEALGQLAGGIAHDFNNVMQAVQGGARLIEKRPDDVPRVRSLAGMIAQSAARGGGITRRLLAFSRRGDLHAEAVDAALLLGEMSEILTHTLGAGVSLSVEVAGKLPPLLADKGQLETVLVNLATNARDAMPGGGELRFSAAFETVPGAALPAHGLRAGEYVRLCVADTGMGMDAEVLARACEPFFTTKDIGQGTGLGLAMSRGFAEQSGGAMAIESAPGQGTRVSLWFPVAGGGAQAVPAAKDADQASTPRMRARLLMVDDEALVRATLSQQMRDEGFAVTVAAGGAEALRLVEDGLAVDLLVADLSMPGMDGLALVRAMQARVPGLPAILLTGFATNAAELAVGDALAGRFALLRKPVEGSALAERVAVMLAGTA